MKKTFLIKIITLLSIIPILIIMANLAATKVLADLENNGGFESWPGLQSDGSVPGAYIDVDNPLQWAWFSDNGKDVRRNRENFTKRSGTYSIKMAVPYDNSSGQNVGFYQTINAMNGATYRLQMYTAGFPNYNCGNPVIAYKIGSQPLTGVQFPWSSSTSFSQRYIDVLVNDPGIPTRNTTTLSYYALMHVNCPNSTNPGDIYFDDFTVTKIADPPPSAPTNLSASCPSPGTTGTLNWTSGTGAAYDNLRIDNQANPWSGICPPVNTGDKCYDPGSPGNFTSIAGATYGWWVDSCNSSGCTTRNGTNFTCITAPRPIIISADNCTGTPSPGQINQSITWNVNNVSGGTGTYTYTWSGDDGLSGTTSNTTATSNSVNKTYTAVGTGTKNASVTISSGTSTLITKTCSITITAPAPTVDLKANNSDGPVTGLANNSSPTLSWTTTNSPTSCTASGSWLGSKSITSGSSQVVGPLTGPTNYTYTLTCTNAAQSATDSVTVSVNGPTGNPPLCTPESNSTFCSRLGKNCGTVTGSDNCSTNRTVTCGVCTSPQTCGGGGTSNVCGGAVCTPETDPAFCSRLGKNCGTLTGTDNCSTNRTVTCGICSGSQTCTANVCGGGTPSSGGSAWIQTINGDVHSNTGIKVGP